VLGAGRTYFEDVSSRKSPPQAKPAKSENFLRKRVAVSYPQAMELAPDRIRHTVAFRLRHAPGSAEESDFLAAAERLGSIPGVEAFEVLAEVSPKNDFRFGISMEFADAAAYTAYNEHPDHVRFVAERWVPEVEDFQEVDYAPR
jgi:hypothetical protein